MSDFIEGVEQYFQETPREKILEDLAKTAEWDNVSLPLEITDIRIGDMLCTKTNKTPFRVVGILDGGEIYASNMIDDDIWEEKIENLERVE